MPSPVRLEGTFTAIVTPFRDDAKRSIDWDAYGRLVAHQLDGKITGIVPCGTTGESPTLDHEEHLELVRRTVELAKGKALVVAGTGSNSTREALDMTQAAEKMGVDAVMVVVPYYNRPTQDGLVEHFVTVASSVKCPVVVYNVPGRTGSDLLTASLQRIAARAPNVVAVKEATGNVLRCQEIVRTMGDRLTVLCGDDALTLPMVSVGARGVISVTSNVYPAEVTRATRLALDGQIEEARRAHLALCGVHEAMFVESNPSPAKSALAHRGLLTDVVRSPLLPTSAEARARVLRAMQAYEAG